MQTMARKLLFPPLLLSLLSLLFLSLPLLPTAAAQANPPAAETESSAVQPSCSSDSQTDGGETCSAETVVIAAAASSPKQEIKKNLPLAALTLRKAQDRGHANLGWLNSYHTFSFSSYQDSAFEHFHSLRVINEDRVKGGQGFGSHPHSDFEIFSYVVQGELRHDDSLGNREVLRRGDVQFTSAGTGISHSEYNNSPSALVAFLQIWVVPERRGLQPGYQTHHFPEADKLNQLRLILSPNGRNDSITLHQDMDVYASLLQLGREVSFELPHGREAYLHLVQDVTGFTSEAGETRIEVNGRVLSGGDGVYIRHASAAAKSSLIRIQGASLDPSRPAEFLLFDIKKSSNENMFG